MGSDLTRGDEPPTWRSYRSGLHYLMAPYSATTNAVQRQRAAWTATAAGLLWSQIGARGVVYAPTVMGHQIAQEAAGLRGLGWEDWWRPVSARAVIDCVAWHALLLDGWQSSVGMANEVAWVVRDMSRRVDAWVLDLDRRGRPDGATLRWAGQLQPDAFTAVDPAQVCTIWRALA